MYAPATPRFRRKRRKVRSAGSVTGSSEGLGASAPGFASLRHVRVLRLGESLWRLSSDASTLGFVQTSRPPGGQHFTAVVLISPSDLEPIVMRTSGSAR